MGKQCGFGCAVITWLMAPWVQADGSVVLTVAGGWGGRGRGLFGEVQEASTAL